MSLSIDNLIPIDADKIGNTSDQILLTSDDLTNSSCLFNSLLYQTVKLLKTQPTIDEEKPTKLFLILFNQTFNEISRYQMKSFGLNLKPLKDSEKLLVMDLLTDFEQIKTNGSVSFDSVMSNTLHTIREKLSSDSDQSKAIILVDDASCLLSLGLPINQVHQYYRRLRNLVHYYKFVLIIQSYYDYEEDDAENNRLCRSLIDTSNTWIICKHLDSGFSSKVDGNLIINNYHEWPTKINHFHFKRMPRNIRILPIGAFA
ncbi:uncharacterized protein LOC128397718 [Panonychus citri]|uniref:uncharacterized protein LOC128397718 n=1 Tax=Panonychus citri TaxID=50023 RepID=UPI0023082CE5|nr:uncharacterized protein LOC128397718 [Panonychus citri]